MPSFTDQIGRTIYLESAPKRIISLVPSQTELLSDLGLNEEVVGITKFCVHPAAWFYTKKRVGGTKTIDIQGIHSLNPDLIIANKEENLQGQVESLATNYPVFITDVHDLASALSMIVSVGHLTGTSKEATRISDRISNELFTFSRHANTRKSKLNTAYLIWKDPIMTVGGDTFIHSMMTICGVRNAFGHMSRYPEISVEDIQKSNCELLLLSSEPYPFKEHHVHELQASLPNTTILLVNGEMFSWYGSRLLQVTSYFKEVFAALETPRRSSQSTSPDAM